MGVWWGRGSSVWRSCTGNGGSWQPTSSWSPAPRDPRPSDARAGEFGRGAGCCCDYAAAERRGRSQGRKTVLFTFRVTLRVTLQAMWPMSTCFKAPIGPFPPHLPAKRRSTRAHGLSSAPAATSGGCIRFTWRIPPRSEKLRVEFKQSEFKTALNSDCLNSNSHL